MLILGVTDLTIESKIRVMYHNIPMNEDLEKLLLSSLPLDPFLSSLKVDASSDAPVHCVINGQQYKPLQDPILDAFQLTRPAKMTPRILRRILDIKSQELIGLLVQVFGSKEPIEFKYPGLWLG